MATAIDLFAGIGGIRLGFDRAFDNKLKTVFVCELDKSAQKTYKANFSDSENIAGDITQVNEQDIPPFDICLAGFPCQAFRNCKEITSTNFALFTIFEAKDSSVN